MFPAGFEPATPGRERPLTHALDGAATEIGCRFTTKIITLNVRAHEVSALNFVFLSEIFRYFLPKRK